MITSNITDVVFNPWIEPAAYEQHRGERIDIGATATYTGTRVISIIAIKCCYETGILFGNTWGYCKLKLEINGTGKMFSLGKY